ncbi:MAG: hypothetical protein ACOYOM_07860 [Chloroflexota bacterium]|jgi:hypothetical protein|nr:hypothetical protein [Chloroflexota bacterium]
MSPISETAFAEFLQRLHRDAMQHAASISILIAVWEGAHRRADANGEAEAAAMVRDEARKLAQALASLEADGHEMLATSQRQSS